MDDDNKFTGAERPPRRIALPLRRTSPFDPPAWYAELRRDAPVSRAVLADGRPVWLVARHADVREVLRSPALSSDPRKPGFPEPEAGDRPPLLIEMDPPEHTALRRILANEFSPGRLAVLSERIAADADACIDAMLAGERPADLVTAYAVPIPARAICHLLGVPFADSAFFQAQVAKVSAAGGEDKAAAFAEVHAYLDALVRAKELAPTDDLLGRLVCEQLRPGAIDHATLVGIAVILLMAGFDSTASMIALSVATLFRWPEQRALLAADPGLMQGAVEELLRFHTLGDADALRVAIADVEIGGRQIRAGEGVIPLVWSANRDEAVFERPDEFDVRRQAHGQLAFGHGIHQCLGLNLARIELRIALRTLFARLPGLRPAIALEAMPWRHESEVFGLLALPVAW